ncbi:MAG: hypothetical protein AN487_14360 [Anabaena sp. CRKS33]|jgi:hypothetical protein|nr:MAG: hypothetical protein AN487_14360 [Anabaena sp. CRKS33]
MTNSTDTQTNQTTNKARILKIAAILGTAGIICGIGVVVTLISPAFSPHQEVTETPKFNAEKNINNPGDKNQC